MSARTLQGQTVGSSIALFPISMSPMGNVPPALLHISATVCHGKTCSLMQRDLAAGQRHHGPVDGPALCMAQVVHRLYSSS